VSVVVHDGDAGGASDHLEATVHTAKALKSFPDGGYGDIQTDPNRNRGGGVEDVVGAGNMKPELAQIRGAIVHYKSGAGTFAGGAYGLASDAEVRALTLSIGD
jgi:hypothetical protein